MTGFMKKFLTGFLLISILTITGCAENRIEDLEGGETGEAALVGDVSYVEGDSIYYSIASEATGKASGDVAGEFTGDVQVTVPDAGQLTASEWNDLENYDFYLSLFEPTQDQLPGIFEQYFNKGYLDTKNMISIHFHNDEVLLFGGKVELYNSSQEVIYTAFTDVFGNAYLFPKTGETDSISRVEVTYNGVNTVVNYTYTTETNTVDIDVDTTNSHEDVIEIMFVVDTTGSMGDEITFLKVELDNVISEVSRLNPNSVIKLALLFYRDTGDTYVTRYFDFTTDIEAQQIILGIQNAIGGGDFPEAVSTALYEAVNKNWSDENSTKLIFHVLDAPPHDTQESMTKYTEALKIASENGISIIPVASSGIDKYTEYLLRNEAMLTGGTYIFLTNDSGIGGDHIDATVDEVDVELLNQLLVRVIIEYHTGVLIDVIPFVQDDQQQ